MTRSYKKAQPNPEEDGNDVVFVLHSVHMKLLLPGINT
jgi:hypothetical protein